MLWKALTIRWGFSSMKEVITDISFDVSQCNALIANALSTAQTLISFTQTVLGIIAFLLAVAGFFAYRSVYKMLHNKCVFIAEQNADKKLEDYLQSEAFANKIRWEIENAIENRLQATITDDVKVSDEDNSKKSFKEKVV